MEQERRINGNGRRVTDEYCPMHQSLVDSIKEIRLGFKWLIGLLLGHYVLIIGGLGSFVMFLLGKGMIK